jgi:hypothetical protein
MMRRSFHFYPYDIDWNHFSGFWRVPPPPNRTQVFPAEVSLHDGSGAALKMAIEAVLSDIEFDLQSETAERSRASNWSIRRNASIQKAIEGVLSDMVFELQSETACPSSNGLGQSDCLETEALARLGLSLGGFQLVLQSSLFDGVAFDPFSFQEDCAASAEVNVGRRQVL